MILYALGRVLLVTIILASKILAVIYQYCLQCIVNNNNTKHYYIFYYTVAEDTTPLGCYAGSH